MRYVTRARDTFHRYPSGMPAVSSMVLALVAGLTLLMPVDYRAGTDHAHTHSTFQIWIDAATGRSHHYHDDGSEQRALTNAFGAHGQIDHETTNAFAHALDLPHLHAPNDEAVVLGDTPVTQQPDNPVPLTTHMPIQHANILGVLGVLIALLSTGAFQRPCWANGRRLTEVPRLLDPPPPRLAPC